MNLQQRSTTLLAFALIAGGTLLAAPGAAMSAPVLAVVAPAAVTIGGKVAASGTVTPRAAGQQVQVQQLVGARWTRVGVTATTNAAGAWRVVFAPTRGGSLRAVQLTGTKGASAEGVVVTVRPKVLAGRTGRAPLLPFVGTRATWRIAPATWPAGTKVRIEVSIDGRAAGSVVARVARGGVVSAKLPTNGVGQFRARVALPQVPGYAATTSPALAFTVAGAAVGPASSRAWNRALRAGLRFRGVHVPGGSSFDSRMGESVIAFHKAYGRPRTATFEASDWKRLTRLRVVPRDRSAGLHIEIDKGRQILMQVQNGTPTMIVHISSGSTGNTPAGEHKVQWKGLYVPSLYGSLLYRSMAFQGAYAIHGYPSVPTTPASHGCVRVPMWIADTLYRRSPVNTPVLVYEGPGSTGVSLGRAGGLAADVPELTGVDVNRWATEGPTS